MKKAEEILDEFEQEHNPFYPKLMRWTKTNLIRLVESVSQPQPVSVSEENRNHPHYNLANRFIPVAVYFFKNRVVSLDYVLDGEHYSTDENIASVSERVEFGDTTPHQPTKIDEGFISVEDAMPPLAPADECVNELPFSQPVIVKNEIGKEMNGLYDFTERSWIDPVYENNIEYSEEIDGKAEYDHKITHWKAIAKLINGGNE